MSRFCLYQTVGIVLAAGLLAAGTGCGGQKVVPVSGTVTIDGRPLTRGYIFVMPPDNRAAGGAIDSQGRFKLTTYEEGDGCHPGTHQVTVTSTEQLSPTSTKHLIPTTYSQPKTSDVTVNITGPMDNLDVKLTWAGGQPYVQNVEGQGDAGPVLGAADAKPAKPAE